MNHQFSSLERDHMLEDMTKKTYDLFIIGGGITGAGTALDAASRGMKVALSEMQDFAAGTSSRSTKLVHGGLRYLKQFEVKMVAEVGKERAIVYENDRTSRRRNGCCCRFIKAARSVHSLLPSACVCMTI